jgi:hypothetical protein
MALNIEWFNRGVTKRAEWHVGEPLPELGTARVYKFQADGDELDVLLFALQDAAPKVPVTIEGETNENPRSGRRSDDARLLDGHADRS